MRLRRNLRAADLTGWTSRPSSSVNLFFKGTRQIPMLCSSGKVQHGQSGKTRRWRCDAAHTREGFPRGRGGQMKRPRSLGAETVAKTCA
eukprot:2185154-Pyramimonas_sp.AAC.1